MDDYIAQSKSSRDQKVPIASTLLLINNFIANSTVFLNRYIYILYILNYILFLLLIYIYIFIIIYSFAESCEKRICTVSNNITKLEILLAVLEAKLNSIPGINLIIIIYYMILIIFYRFRIFIK